MQSQLLIPATSVYLFQVTDNFMVSLNIDNEYQKTKLSLCPFHFVNKPPKVMSKRKNIILFFFFPAGFPLKAVCIQHTGQAYLNALPNIPLVSKDYRLQTHRTLISGRRQWQDR